MSATPRLSLPAAAERLRFISRTLLVLFVAGWLSWFYPFDDLLDRMGTPCGADFCMFYVAGQVAADGEIVRLYDQAEHQRRLHDLFQNLDRQFCLPYRYPPLVAVILSPLAALDYAWAYGLFAVTSLAAWLMLLWLLSKKLEVMKGPWRHAIWWSMVGWPVALETLTGGQASMIAALIAVAALCLLQTGRPIAAGAILALALYKPNVLAILGLGMIIRSPRLLLGAIPMGVLLLALSVATCGWSSLQEYLHLSQTLVESAWTVETPYWKVHSSAGWIGSVLPQHSRFLALAGGLTASVILGFWWRQAGKVGPSGFWQGAAMLLVANAFFNPYTPIYDLVLLGPAALFAAEALHGKLQGPAVPRAWTVQLAIAALFFGPHLSQAIAKSVGVQLFPVILLVIAIWQFQVHSTYCRSLAGGRSR